MHIGHAAPYSARAAVCGFWAKEWEFNLRGIAVPAVQEQAGLPALQELDVIKSSFQKALFWSSAPSGILDKTLHRSGESSPAGFSSMKIFCGVGVNVYFSGLQSFYRVCLGAAFQ